MIKEGEGTRGTASGKREKGRDQLKGRREGGRR